MIPAPGAAPGIRLGYNPGHVAAIAKIMNLLQSKSRSKAGRRAVIELQKAERALKDGNHKEVEQLCNEVLEERPDSFQACQVLAELRLKQRRFDDGMAWIERALEMEPGNARSMNLLGRVLDHRGDLAAAEASFRKAVEAQPEYADALANLGDVLQRIGRIAEAEQFFRRAIQFDREHGLANLSLGAMLYAQHRPELAVPHLQTGIQRELTNRAGQYTLAVALQELGRLDEAITAYRRLVAAGDSDPAVFAQLGAVLDATGDLAGATAGYEAALEIDPGYAPAAAGLAGILAISFRATEALELLAPLMDRGDAPACLHIAHARALRELGRHDEALLHLADLVKRPLGTEEFVVVHHLLGELLDKRGEYDRAFAQHRRANRLSGKRYDAARHEDLISRLIGVYTREMMDGLPRGSSSDTPVFIVGMPRAGASLVEHIIASHPRAAGAGALPHIDLGAGRIGRYNNASLPYPECAIVLRERYLRELSAAYLSRLFMEGERVRRIVDSAWLNYLHLGLIELMFPHSRVIHCRRAPLDNGLACYFHDFGNADEPFACDLADIGHYYGQYLRLMDHWGTTSRLPILEISYEALVRDQETETRRLLEFLGLPWNPACLAFHENQRIVRSWNHHALRRPLNAASVGWSAHYEKHLEPLREALAAAGHPVA
jgi:tetratricopeptide (TPR) repeat protein